MRNIIYITVLVILTSCSSSKPMVNSLSVSKIQSNIYNYYDDKGKIDYQVFNDKTNLFVNLRTSDKMAIIKILNSGLSVYFDETGKKSKDVVVEYPLHNKNFNFSQLKLKKKINSRSDFDVNQLLISVPNSAIFKKGEDIEQFNLELNSTNISIKLEVVKTKFEDDLLVYKLEIPLNKITNKSISELNNLSIGIVSGKIKTPQRSQGVRKGSHSGRGHGRKSGGGKSSGVGRSSNISTEITKPITIWFDLKFE